MCPPTWLRPLGIACVATFTLAAAHSAASTAPADASAEPSPVFLEAARATGLDFVHSNGMSGQLYFSEMMGPGVALFDYDDDGDLDVFLLQGHPLGRSTSAGAPAPAGSELRDRLFRNDLGGGPGPSPTPHFVDVTAASGLLSTGYGMGVATGDVDNDGFVDLYVTNWGPNHLFHNNGDGTFTDVTAASGTDDPGWSVSAAFLDYDRDGWLDLFVTNYVDYSLATHKVCRSYTGAPDYCSPLAYRPQPDRLLHNRGDGTFEVVTARAGLADEYGNGLGVVTGDFNGDGWPDLYVANDGMPNQMWINLGDGTFRNDALLAGTAVNAQGRPEAGMGVAAGDVDNDGDEELILSHLSQETNTLYLDQGDGAFRDATVTSGLAAPSWGATGFGIGWIDYDNDGWLDLFVVNGAVKHLEGLVRAGDPFPLHQPNQLFHNRSQGPGDPRFEEVTSRAGAALELSEVSRGAAFGDVDNDGDTDVVVADDNGPARLLLNQVGARNHWLGLRLLGGPRAGRPMLGAWTEVRRRGRPALYRRCRTDGSYASAGDPRVLFGLGEDPATSAVRVRWPSGRTEEWQTHEVDRYLVLVEKTATASP